MKSNSVKQFNLKTDELFRGLSDREREVLASRYGLTGNKSTLAKIGGKFNLSRERIRQIENRAKIKITNQQTSGIDIINQLISRNGGLISEQVITEVINDQGGVAVAMLILDSIPNVARLRDKNFGKNTWKIKELKIETIFEIIDKISNLLIEKKSATQLARIAEELDLDGSDRYLAESIIRSHNKFVYKSTMVGLASDRKINPKTISDKVLYIMEKHGQPIHFTEITEKILASGFDSKKINKSSVHNELIASDDFVLIGRGIYALKKWGYKEGTIEEIITNFLNQHSGPQSTNDIIEHLLTERKVRRNTVLVNLTKSAKFVRTNDGKYALKK